jgi:hypothetical protein
MKEHWVFIEDRAGPMICSKAGIRIHYMDREDEGPDLVSRIPGLLIIYDDEKRRFKISRVNDRTGIEVEGGRLLISQRTSSMAKKEGSDVGQKER